MLGIFVEEAGVIVSIEACFSMSWYGGDYGGDE
jgi:hypothetical protein